MSCYQTGKISYQTFLSRLNKYGTYEIQRTNGMENPYPMIAQGLSEQEAQEQLTAAERWKKSF